MTQALNLANFANNLNTAGATSNSGLQNSSVTVTAGTGMSGGGAVALGSSVTLTNAGVTSVAAGTGISVSGSTGAVTISASGGGVTSAVAGNGVAVSGATGAVTFSASCPTAGSVGSYVNGSVYILANNNVTANFGSNYSAGSSNNNVGLYNPNTGSWIGGLSGTWKWLAGSGSNTSTCSGPAPGVSVLLCRVA
jgi:hypothetical protein